MLSCGTTTWVVRASNLILMLMHSPRMLQLTPLCSHLEAHADRGDSNRSTLITHRSCFVPKHHQVLPIDKVPPDMWSNLIHLHDESYNCPRIQYALLSVSNWNARPWIESPLQWNIVNPVWNLWNYTKHQWVHQDLALSQQTHRFPA